MITVSITRTRQTRIVLPQHADLFSAATRCPSWAQFRRSKFSSRWICPRRFGPVIAYRRPAIKVVVTSSNSTRAPYRMDILLMEIIALIVIVGIAFTFEPEKNIGSRTAFRSTCNNLSARTFLIKPHQVTRRVTENRNPACASRESGCGASTTTRPWLLLIRASMTRRRRQRLLHYRSKISPDPSAAVRLGRGIDATLNRAAAKGGVVVEAPHPDSPGSACWIAIFRDPAVTCGALSGRSALKVVAGGSKSSARPDVLFGSNVNAFHDYN